MEKRRKSQFINDYILYKQAYQDTGESIQPLHHVDCQFVRR